MVRNATSLGRSGLQDWLVQRVTALILAVYCLLMGYFFLTTNITYAVWQAWFTSTTVRTLTTLVLLSFVLHAWIGLWTVTTDYLKRTCYRLSIQLLVIIALVTFFLWGIQIIWGLGT